MNELGILFLSGLIGCSGPYKTVTVELPSPCYAVEKKERKGQVLYLYLKRTARFCPQVVTLKPLKVERDVEKLVLVLDNRVLRELKLSEEK
ncbi:MAG: hypothetical protein GXO03_01325 [Aquificae bacterium]|nr:hypothetical protein [Aquificota bacterium]